MVKLPGNRFFICRPFWRNRLFRSPDFYSIRYCGVDGNVYENAAIRHFVYEMRHYFVNSYIDRKNTCFLWMEAQQLR